MIFKAAIGIMSVLGINSILKDNKEPKSKEEIKDNIRKTSSTIGKYITAICEVANENLNNVRDETNENKDEEYFKNINKKG